MEVLQRELLSADVQETPSKLVAQVPALAHLLTVLNKFDHLPLVESLPVVFECRRRRKDLVENSVVDCLLRNEWVRFRLWQGLKDNNLVLEGESLD